MSFDPQLPGFFSILVFIIQIHSGLYITIASIIIEIVKRGYRQMMPSSRLRADHLLLDHV